MAITGLGNKITRILEECRQAGVEIFLHPTVSNALRYKGNWNKLSSSLVEEIRENKLALIDYFNHLESLYYDGGYGGITYGRLFGREEKSSLQLGFDFLLEDQQIAPTVTADLDIDRDSRRSKKITSTAHCEIESAHVPILRRLRDSRRLLSKQVLPLNHWFVDGLVRNVEKLGIRNIYTEFDEVRYKAIIGRYGYGHECPYLDHIDELWSCRTKDGRNRLEKARLRHDDLHSLTDSQVIKDFITTFPKLKQVESTVTVFTVPINEDTKEASIYSVKHKWFIAQDDCVIDPMWVLYPNSIFGYWSEERS